MLFKHYLYVLYILSKFSYTQISHTKYVCQYTVFTAKKALKISQIRSIFKDMYKVYLRPLGLAHIVTDLSELQTDLKYFKFCKNYLYDLYILSNFLPHPNLAVQVYLSIYVFTAQKSLKTSQIRSIFLNNFFTNKLKNVSSSPF